jgi:hypothetical protein
MKPSSRLLAASINCSKRATHSLSFCTIQKALEWSPSKRHVHPKSVNVTFGNSTYAQAIKDVEMSLPRIRTHPKPNVSPERRKGEKSQKRSQREDEAESGVRHPQSKDLHDCWQPPEAGRQAEEELLPHSPQKEPTLPKPWL